MTSDATQTINQLATAHPESYRVFFKYNIDFCCGGKKQLASVCAEQDIDPQAVLADLQALCEKSGSTETDWTRLPQVALVEHITETHHDYLREDLPRLYQLAEKVARVHGGRDPHLLDVLTTFHKMATELLDHIEKEEQILFPLVIRVEEEAGSVGEALSMPLAAMETEHEDTGADLEKLARLTGNFETGPGMCNSYKALYEGLKALDQDIKLHIHKENNILFPRAREAVGLSA